MSPDTPLLPFPASAANCHERIRNQRRDYLNKVSSQLASQYSIVCVESLNVKGMVRNRHLARAISDCGWTTFKEMLKYKCDAVIEIEPLVRIEPDLRQLRI